MACWHAQCLSLIPSISFPHPHLPTIPTKQTGTPPPAMPPAPIFAWHFPYPSPPFSIPSISSPSPTFPPQWKRRQNGQTLWTGTFGTEDGGWMDRWTVETDEQLSGLGLWRPFARTELWQRHSFPPGVVHVGRLEAGQNTTELPLCFTWYFPFI